MGILSNLFALNPSREIKGIKLSLDRSIDRSIDELMNREILRRAVANAEKASFLSLGTNRYGF